MKRSDVKVGMRVAKIDANGERYGFGTVKFLVRDEITLDDCCTCVANDLRKVKPKKSFSFKDVVMPADTGSQGYIRTHELCQFVGKRVIVTIREIK